MELELPTLVEPTRSIAIYAILSESNDSGRLAGIASHPLSDLTHRENIPALGECNLIPRLESPPQ